jgi:hypothetical protein
VADRLPTFLDHKRKDGSRLVVRGLVERERHLVVIEHITADGEVRSDATVRLPITEATSLLRALNAALLWWRRRHGTPDPQRGLPWAPREPIGSSDPMGTLREDSPEVGR